MEELSGKRYRISSLKDKKVEEMEGALGLDLSIYEKTYGTEDDAVTPGSRLKVLIQHAHEQTGLPAVVIIDEYDSPICLTHRDCIPLQSFRLISQCQ